MDMRVGGVHRHEDGVEVVAVDRVDEGLGAVVSGDAEIAHHLLLLHVEQRFHRAALGEDLVHIVHRADVVQLPEIDMIGLQQLERLLNHAHRSIPRALFSLGGEKCFLPPRLHHPTNILLAPAVGAAVNG